MKYIYFSQQVKRFYNKIEKLPLKIEEELKEFAAFKSNSIMSEASALGTHSKNASRCNAKSKELGETLASKRKDYLEMLLEENELDQPEIEIDINSEEY